MRPQSISLRLVDIADRLGGVVEGNPETFVCGVETLQNARTGHLTFLSSPRYKSQLPNTRASAIILSRADSNLTSLPRIVCDDPYAYLARALSLLYPPDPPASGVHPTAVVARDARVASNAFIGPFCEIGPGAVVGERVWIAASCTVGKDAQIGNDSQLHPQVVLYDRARVGERVIIHSGAVIGSDGFGMARNGAEWLKIPQVGGVIVGDDVEIGSNTTIDRGAIADTVVGRGVKLDNQIQIGHNVQIGEHTAIAGCVGIAGSARIGRQCTIGGGAIILGHLEISDHVNIGAGTIVTKSINQPGDYAGLYPMQKRDAWARSAARIRHLDDIDDRIRNLEHLVRRLNSKE